MSDMAAASSVRDHDWYRWLSAWTFLSLPGTLLAVLLWGVSAMPSALLFPALVGSGAQAVALSSTRASVATVHLLRACGRAGIASAIIAVAVVAMGDISGSAALGIVLLLGLSTPYVRSLLPSPRVRTSQSGSEHPRHDDVVAHSLALPTTAPGVPGLMSDAELCSAWCRSYTSLQRARSLEERSRLVALRQSYLDELEDRNVTALRAWLASGARAAGSPETYLRRS